MTLLPARTICATDETRKFELNKATQLAARYLSRIVAYTKKSTGTMTRARARSPGVALGALRADIGVATTPFCCSSPDAPPPPDTGRCVALSSAISPSSWGRTIIRSQLVRSPKIRRMVRPIRSRQTHEATIRSIFGRRHPFFRPQLVPDVVGQQLVHWARLGTSRRDFVLRRRETA